MAVSVMEDIIDHIEATTSLVVRGGYIPETPDTVCVVMSPEPGGEPNLEVMGTTIGTITIEKPLIEIRCRGPSNKFLTANNNAWIAYRAIHNTVDATIGTDSTRYLMIEALQTPFTFGSDENGRWLIGFRIQVWKEPNV